MSLHGDLLHQARMLATNEPRRPRQASLRRAVSTGYYALFHLLTHDAVSRWITGTDRAVLRSNLRRAFQHRTMADACKEIVKPGGGRLAPALAGEPISAPLAGVAGAFVELQQARHDADYDLAQPLTRAEALELIGLAEQAFADWSAVRKTLAADVLLAALLAKAGMCR